MKAVWCLLLVLLLLAVAGSVAWRFMARNDDFQFDRKSVRMEVVNACGVPRIGRAVADNLQMRGYDVYGAGNATKHFGRTTVVDLRDASGRTAGRVARSLAVTRRWWRIRVGRPAIPDTTVEIDSSRYLEVRLVVGDDYRRFFPGVVPLY